ncbi:Tex family protein [Amphibacillus jilinensis]|uniref:Tex family protein n=1 Tax=Amphibacillus jilinensis TaxID=1216008 RepID=UPI0002EAD5F7|nr:Tex family protein [Amphibacillus jilinensis]
MEDQVNQVHIIETVSSRVKVNTATVKQVIHLLQEGNTVPFIARYRKEQTGGLDEVQIKEIEDQWQYGVQLAQRKEEVIRLIDEQGKLTPELKQNIETAEQLQRVEDFYRPYKQKRRTKATIAKEKGLEPLAELIWKQSIIDLAKEAEAYLSEDNALLDTDQVLAGANDIIAEWIADEASYRDYIRKQTFTHGKLQVKRKSNDNDEKGVYEMYYEYEEAIKSIVAHRILAMNRGEKEDVLKVSVDAPLDTILTFLKRKIIRHSTSEAAQAFLAEAIADSYKRLIQPAIEREVRASLTESAEEQAIEIFSKNLKNLLLQPPLKGKMILAVDPAFRTGCKLAIVNETGRMIAVDVIYPTAPKNDIEGATSKVRSYVKQYNIELIAIGNGTASRETEQFIANVIEQEKLTIPYIIVNEAGASVYSASKLAREEFPDLQVEERSAVSIARRVQDPLAELVKIDPKSIGVGQYQHDVSQKRLNESLKFVVETAVNKVGVNVNTASISLLQYVSGLSKAVANNIVKQREDIGKFSSRKQLKDIPRLGQKTYEQSIGFLRINDGEEPLDRTPIHPESYQATVTLLKMIECTKTDLGTQALQDKLATLELDKVAKELGIGQLTLQDIIKALSSPERDPRDDLPKPLLKKNVLTMEDLKPGLELQGTVRNVVDFGVFVDIGVKQDGLVHISKMSNRFVKHPMDIASVGDVITVWVDQVDLQKERIALTMVKND